MSEGRYCAEWQQKELEIQLMQQLKNYKERSSSLNQENRQVSCELCLNDAGKEVGVCGNCLTFICHSCSQQHICGQPSTPPADLSEPKIDKSSAMKPSQYNFYFKSSQNGDASRMDTFAQKTSRITCERCNFKQAAKKCKTCKVHNYCLVCFRQIHSGSKMLGHQAIDLIGSEINEKRSVLNIIHSQFQNKKGQNNKQIYFNLQRSQSSTGIQISSFEDNQETKRLAKERGEAIKQTKLLLGTLRNQMELELKVVETTNNEYISIVNRQFQKVIEEARLKMVEFEMKLKEKIKTSIEQCKIILKDIKRSEVVANQMLILVESKNSYSLEQKINEKLKKQIQSLKDLYKRQEQIKSRGITQKVSDHFYNEVQQLKQKIKKIQLKKVITSEDITKSQAMSNYQTPRKSHGDAKSKNDVKSCKNINTSLISYKSMDRLDTLSVGLTPPQKEKRTKKSTGNSGNNQRKEKVQANHTTYYSAINQSETNMKNIQDKDMTFSVKIKVNPQTNKKDTRSKANIQKSVRKSIKSGNMHQSDTKNDKNNVNKAMSNIQQTKQIIKDIRTQITDFNKRFGDKQNSMAVKRTTTLEDQQEECLGISHISIESILQKRK